MSLNMYRTLEEWGMNVILISPREALRRYQYTHMPERGLEDVKT